VFTQTLDNYRSHPVISNTDRKRNNKSLRVAGRWGRSLVRRLGYTLFRQSAHRWQLVRQPYESAAIYAPSPSGRLLMPTSCELSRDQSHRAAWRIRSVEKSSNINGNRTCHLPACRVVPRPTNYATLRSVTCIQELRKSVFSIGVEGCPFVFQSKGLHAFVIFVFAGLHISLAFTFV
jgi:hypothetical protein